MTNTQRWTPILEGFGISKSHPRFNDLCEYAENQKNLLKAGSVNESVNNPNGANSPGAGPVIMPGVNPIPGQQGTRGSLDIAQTVLPASVKIAAHTPGFQLLPVINVNSNRVDMVFHDYKYDKFGGDVNGTASAERGTTFKLDMDAADVTALKLWLRTEGVKIERGRLNKKVFINLEGTGITTIPQTDFETIPANKEGIVQISGFSKIDGMPMFRIFTQDNAASTGNWGFSQPLNTLPNTDDSIAYYFSATNAAELSFNSVSILTITGTPRAYEVSLNEDVVDDFTTNRTKTGMTRDEWDVTTAGKIGPETRIATVQMGVRHISATLRLSEIGDFQRMHGINIVNSTKEQLVNQMQQELSIEIVDKVKELGERNRQQVLNLSSTGVSNYDMDLDAYLSSGLFESSFSMVRKLWQKVKAGSFFIKSDGKLGGADYAIVGSNMAAALSEMKGFQALPYEQHSLNTNKSSLENLGSIDGIKIILDPTMMPDDTSIYLGRVGTDSTPGLKFFAYMLAEEIQIVPERTLGSLLYLYSRYAIAEFGWFPEKQYLAIHATYTGGSAADLLF